MKGLVVQNVSFEYGKKVVLKGLSLRVAPEETLVLMGPSGSGKTTLLHVILGIAQPRTGHIKLNSRDITYTPIEERNIGYLPQDYGLFPHMNVMENVAYGLMVRGMGKTERELQAKKMLGLVELAGYEARGVNELSGGQKQRVALARALTTNPDILLLDEPLSNIDEVTKGEVARELKRLFKKLKIPIVLVTHNREDAIFFAQRLAIMLEGKIAQEGTVKQVIHSPKTPLIKTILSSFLEGG